ncbi:MAG: hypothetical protein JOZ29_00125 [Deltaproteobacteria bacterium]|nr:hypothetical protein [Deltaproteobacteria bacterium]
MKCLSSAVAGATALLVLASAGRPFAGVVVAETSFAKGPKEQISSQDKTVYVQGNKQRIELGNVAEITDLDKNVVYIVNKHDRAFAEMPLQAPSSSPPDGMQDEVILKKTGKVRLIANHPCSEYRRVEGNELEHVTISACVSTSAPGAKELSGFARNIVTRLSGRKFERPAEKGSAGLMLEKQSVLSFRVPDSSPGRTYRTASYLVETRVNKITVQPLPPETFNPPDGYSKLQNLPPRTAPPDLAILMSSI